MPLYCYGNVELSRNLALLERLWSIWATLWWTGGIFYSFLDAQGLPIDFYIIPTSSENDDTGSAQNGCVDRIPRLLGDMVRNKSENKYRAINDSLNVVLDRCCCW